MWAGGGDDRERTRNHRTLRGEWQRYGHQGQRTTFDPTEAEFIYEYTQVFVCPPRRLRAERDHLGLQCVRQRRNRSGLGLVSAQHDDKP